MALYKLMGVHGFTGGVFGVEPVGLKDLILFESVVRKGLDYTTPPLLLFQDGNLNLQYILLRGSGYLVTGYM